MPQIGHYALYTIETGRFGLDGGAMFGIVPKPLWEKKIAPDEQNRIPLNMRCLLLESTDRLILIDTGLGHKYDERFADIYKIDHERYNICESFEEHGFSVDEVTDVILTHLHFDHCGGGTHRQANGEVEPTFENAQYHVQREHWEWARAANPKEKNSFLKDDIEPLAASGQLTLVDDRQELFPGLEVIPVGGHTEAQQIVKISDHTTALVFVADLIPTSAHLKSAWTMAYDIEPLISIDEKQKFLEHAVENNWQLFFEHDPEVEIASLERDDRGIAITDPRPLSDL